MEGGKGGEHDEEGMSRAQQTTSSNCQEPGVTGGEQVAARWVDDG